jgi:hypothetical protein
LAPADDAKSTLAAATGEQLNVQGKWLTLPPALGFYKLTNDAGAWDLGASLLSEQESLLNNEQAKDSRQPISQGRSPVHWFTLLAIVVLTGESILYHRRKLG